MKKNETLREKICAYAKEKYASQEEHLWFRFPDYAVFRHTDNQKWYAIVMDVPDEKLGISGKRRVDVLNVKLDDPLFADLLLRQEGYFRGYHIARGNWISVLLDGTVPFQDVCELLDMSYSATASAKNKQKLRPPKDWLVPANPKYYDVVGAFEQNDEIDWKQGSGIRVGDTVFLYVAAPVSAVLFRCAVTKTDIPFDYKGGELSIKALMRIKLLKRYDPGAFTFEVLKEHGVYAVRGPRDIPNSLRAALLKENR